MAEEVLLRRDREHERADREQQSPRTRSAPTPMITAKPAVSERRDEDRQRERQARELDRDDAEVEVADRA